MYPVTPRPITKGHLHKNKGRMGCISRLARVGEQPIGQAEQRVISPKDCHHRKRLVLEVFSQCFRFSGCCGEGGL